MSGEENKFSAIGIDHNSGYRWTVLVITTIGAFMTPLDGSIVTIAIPSIASSISIGLEAAVWIPLAYLLLLTVLLINVGRLGDLRGRKRFYTLGFIIFTVGSVLCGFSLNAAQLVTFRAMQGVGAAFIAANSAAIVTDSFPAWERGKALGINTMAVYTGLSAGPVIGGILVQNYGWRSIFFVNVPIGILVVALTVLKLKETQVHDDRIRTRLSWGHDPLGRIGVAAITAYIWWHVWMVFYANNHASCIECFHVSSFLVD